MIKYEKITLSNGLRTIFVPMNHTEAVTVLLLVNTGSRFENKKQNGISHFLEHLFFKGTPQRPSTGHIANELDSIGAEYNAFTSEEYTGFYVRCAKSKFEKAIDILGDIINNSSFHQDEITKEKGVIIEEINMYEDLPQKQIIDLTKEHFYGNTPLGRSTLGTKQNIRRISREDIVKYKDTHYTTKNSILVIAGAGNRTMWQKKAEFYFQSFKNAKAQKCETIKPIVDKTSIKIKYKKTDQAHITIGFKTFQRKDPRRYALKLIDNIFGETMSSRLFTEVREKRGLAYYVGSDTWYFNDTGSLIAYAGVDTKRLNEAIQVINAEFKKIGKKSITKNELQKAKDNIEGKMFLGLEDSFSVAEFFAEQELLYNKIEKPEEIVKKIKQLSLDDVNDLSRNLVYSNKLKLTIIGPYKSDTQFANLL